MSYTGLVLDLDDPKTRKEFLDQVVLFVVEGGAAVGPDRHRPVRNPVLRIPRLPVVGTGPDHAVGDHLHRLVERDLAPAPAIRRTVFHRVLAQRPVDQLSGCGALRTEPAPRNRAVRVALNLGHHTVLDEDTLPTTHGAEGADGFHNTRVADAWFQLDGMPGADRSAQAQPVVTLDLLYDGPATNQL